MTKDFDLSVNTELQPDNCVECGHRVTHAGGPLPPKPGDFTLCIRCASLNVFDGELRLRKPSDDEFFRAAASSDIQELRRRIVAVKKHMGTGQ